MELRIPTVGIMRTFIFKFNNKAKAENQNKSYIQLDFNWTENNKTD